MQTLMYVMATAVFATLLICATLGAVALLWIMVDIFKDFCKERSRTLQHPPRFKRERRS